jgi:hypothetical protein
MLDIQHLLDLGPQAIPALDRAFRQTHAMPFSTSRRNLLAAAHRHRAQDWRGWTYRNWQLSRYLEREDATRP